MQASVMSSTLQTAIRAGHLAKVRCLLEDGANPNTVVRGQCPLVTALKLEDEALSNAIACLLLEHGADPHGRSNTVSPINLVITRRRLPVLRAMARLPAFINTPLPNQGDKLVTGLVLDKRWEEGLLALEEEGVDIRWDQLMKPNEDDPEQERRSRPSFVAALHALNVDSRGKAVEVNEWVRQVLFFLARPLSEEEVAPWRIEVASVLAQRARLLPAEVFDRLEQAWKDSAWWSPAAGRMAVYRHLTELLNEYSRNRQASASERDRPWELAKRLVESTQLPLDGENDPDYVAPVVERLLRLCAITSTRSRLFKQQIERLEWALDRGARWEELVYSEWLEPAWVKACAEEGANWAMLEPLRRRGWDPRVPVRLFVKKEGSQSDLVETRLPFALAVWEAPIEFLEQFFREHPDQVDSRAGNGDGLLHLVARQQMWFAPSNSTRLAMLIGLVARMGGQVDARNHEGDHFFHVLLKRHSDSELEESDLEPVLKAALQACPDLLASTDAQGVPFWQRLENWIQGQIAYPHRHARALCHQERLKVAFEEGQQSSGRSRL